MQPLQVVQRFIRIWRRRQQNLDARQDSLGNIGSDALYIQAGARGITEFDSFEQTLHAETRWAPQDNLATISIISSGLPALLQRAAVEAVPPARRNEAQPGGLHQLAN